jgi:hypothetical protein
MWIVQFFIHVDRCLFVHVDHSFGHSFMFVHLLGHSCASFVGSYSFFHVGHSFVRESSVGSYSFHGSCALLCTFSLGYLWALLCPLLGSFHVGIGFEVKTLGR